MSLTSEQLEMRREGLGSSDIGTVAGLNPFASPVDLWLVKTGAADPFVESDAMIAGHRLEDTLATWYAEERGEDIAKSGTLRHPKEPWILATPDRFVMKDGKRSRILEIKVVGPRMMRHWDETDDGIPDTVRAQLEWQMLVTGLDVAHVFVLFGGVQPRTYEIHRHAALGEALVEIGRTFWFDHVVKDIPPPPEASERYHAFLAKQFPAHVQPMKLAPAEADELVRTWRRCEARIREAEEEQSLAEAKLKILIGDAEGMHGPFGRVTWKSDSVGKVAWKAVAESLGATEQIAERFRGNACRKFLIAKGETE